MEMARYGPCRQGNEGGEVVMAKQRYYVRYGFKAIPDIYDGWSAGTRTGTVVGLVPDGYPEGFSSCAGTASSLACSTVRK